VGIILSVSRGERDEQWQQETSAENKDVAKAA
jgi:hypothetical protein